MKDLFSLPNWEFISSLWRKEEEGEGTRQLETGERELLEEQLLVRRVMNGLKEERYDTSRAWRKVSKQSVNKDSRHIGGAWGRSAAVAVVLLGVGFALFYMVQKTDEQKLITATGGRVSQQVELILASGECQTLGCVVEVVIDASGKNVQVDTLGKQVIYPSETGDTTLGYNILRVPRGGEYSLRLSDGSEVWLNAESSLRYPVVFSGKSREVYLSGEAFFKVAKDRKRPFHVHAGEEDIQVLGTSFNVSAYPTDIIWHTTLVEGAVSIRERGNESRLQPSCQYRMNRETCRMEIEEVDTELYTSWMEGKIYFKNLSLESIIDRLQRWYDLNMFYQTEDIKQMRFRGTINRYEPMDAVFKKLEQITDLRFVVRGNTVTAMKIK